MALRGPPESLGSGRMKRTASTEPAGCRINGAQDPKKEILVSTREANMRCALLACQWALVVAFLPSIGAASPPRSQEATSANGSHVWYSELAPGLSDKGLRITFPLCVHEKSAEAGLGIATLTPEMAPQLRSIKESPGGWMTVDFCLRHGEIKVLGYAQPRPSALKHRPPCWSSITVDEKLYEGSEHFWYSSANPKLTSKGMRFFLPVCVTGANYGTTPTENAIAAGLYEKVRWDQYVQFTIDFCLHHGEVKVLRFRPPEDEVLASRVEKCRSR